MKSDRSIMSGIKLTVLVDTDDLSLVVVLVGLVLLLELVTSSPLSPVSTLSPGVVSVASWSAGLTSQPPMTSDVSDVSVSEARVASLGLMVAGSLSCTLVTST